MGRLFCCITRKAENMAFGNEKLVRLVFRNQKDIKQSGARHIAAFLLKQRC